MIDEKYIMNKLLVRNQLDLFEKLGQALIQDLIVKEGFVKALLDREQNFPTGLPVVPGVAIPHTDGDLVNEDRLMFVTLENPIKFNEMGGSIDDVINVSVIILIAISNGAKHLSTLKKLIASIQENGFVNGLVDSRDEKEMKTIINKYL